MTTELDDEAAQSGPGPGGRPKRTPGAPTRWHPPDRSLLPQPLPRQCSAAHLLPHTAEQVPRWANGMAYSLSLVRHEVAFLDGPIVVHQRILDTLLGLGGLLIRATGTPDELRAAAEVFRRAQAVEKALLAQVTDLTKRSRGWSGASGDAFRSATGIAAGWLADDQAGVGQVADLLDQAAAAVARSRAEVGRAIEVFIATLRRAQAAYGDRWTQDVWADWSRANAVRTMLAHVDRAAATATTSAERSVADLTATIRAVGAELKAHSAKGGRSPYRSWATQGVKFRVSAGFSKYLGGSVSYSAVPAGDGKTSDGLLRLEISAGTEGSHSKGLKIPAAQFITKADDHRGLLAAAKGAERPWEFGAGVDGEFSATLRGYGLTVTGGVGHNITTGENSAEGSAAVLTGKSKDGKPVGGKVSGSYSDVDGFDWNVAVPEDAAPDRFTARGALHLEVRIPGDSELVGYVTDNAVTNLAGATLKASTNVVGEAVDSTKLAINQHFIDQEGGLDRPRLPFPPEWEAEEFDNEVALRSSLLNRARAWDEIQHQLDRAGLQFGLPKTSSDGSGGQR